MDFDFMGMSLIDVSMNQLMNLTDRSILKMLGTSVIMKLDVRYLIKNLELTSKSTFQFTFEHTKLKNLSFDIEKYKR